ncbi:CDP-alcohol phosphatidyltransferase family protein [Flaviflexus sp.]|uniref:CDP-alcohol phosphatidyltransferase family protein n=1 Tax=Flaviflexus sp. TaxID=1969482 RepID=UPI003F8E23E0
MDLTMEPKLTRDDWLTVPNIITVIRLLLLVPIAYLLVFDMAPVMTAILLVIFGATDWIDGYIARRFNQVSRVGEVLDPIADRLGVAAIAIFLVVGHHLPDWIAYCIVFTDLALATIYLIFKAKHRPKVSYLGKIRTAVLMAGLPLTVFGRIQELDFIGTIGIGLTALGAILHAVTGATYAWEIYRVSKQNREIES